MALPPTFFYGTGPGSTLLTPWQGFHSRARNCRQQIKGQIGFAADQWSYHSPEHSNLFPATHSSYAKGHVIHDVRFSEFLNKDNTLLIQDLSKRLYQFKGKPKYPFHGIQQTGTHS
jgi:hypothetical protein